MNQRNVTWGLMTFIILMSQTAQVLAKDEVDARTTVKISAEVKSELQLSATWAGGAGLEAGRSYDSGHKLGEVKLDFGVNKDQVNDRDYSVYFASRSSRVWRPGTVELENRTGGGSNKPLLVMFEPGVVTQHTGRRLIGIGGDELYKVNTLDKGGVSVGLIVSGKSEFDAGIYTASQEVLLVRN